MAAGSPKDLWDKLQVLSALLTPALVLAVGQWVAMVLKRRDVRVQMVGMALDVLKGKPQENKGDKALRHWAVEVIKHNSDVPLSAEAEGALLDAPLVHMPQPEPWVLPGIDSEFPVDFISEPPGAKVYIFPESMAGSHPLFGKLDDPKAVAEFEQKYGHNALTTPFTKNLPARHSRAGGHAIFVLNGKATVMSLPRTPQGPLSSRQTRVEAWFDDESGTWIE